MKLFMLSLIWIVCIPVFAQDQPATPANIQRHEIRFSEGWVIRTKAETKVSFSAKDIQRDGDLLRLRGSVEIKIGERILQGDEADYNWSTGEITIRGSR